MITPPNTGEDLHPLNTEARIAVMSVEIGHISKTLERIEANGSHAVPRTEWEQRNIYVDARFLEAFAGIATTKAESAKEIAAVRADISSRRAPWWTIVAAGGGMLAILAYLFDIIPTIVN